MPVVMHKHPKLRNLYFAPRQTRLSPDSLVSKKRTAAILGTDAATVDGLIEQRYLTVEPDDRGGHAVTPESLSGFVAELRPVDVEVRETASQAPPASEDEHSEDDATEAPAVTDHDDHDEAPRTFPASCPGCGLGMDVTEGVRAFDCPDCGRRLEVVEAQDERRPNPRRVGIFRRTAPRKHVVEASGRKTRATG